MKETGRRFTSALIAISLVCISLFGCQSKKSAAAEEMLAVHFIDVGQGDCELITTPSGETMLIDAGVPEAGDDIVSYITELGIKEIDVFVATHYHEDHIGGSPDVFEAFDILSVLILDCEVKTACAKKLLNNIEKEESEVVYAERGYEFLLGDAEFLTLSPEKITDKGGNEDSIILRMEYGDSRYIFTGDAEKEAEESVLEAYSENELSADLLKIGHHGSRTSTTDAFLKAVAPSVAIISCGEGNSYGHPHTETVEKLVASVENIYRTDVLGTVVILTDGKGIYLDK